MTNNIKCLLCTPLLVPYFLLKNKDTLNLDLSRWVDIEKYKGRDNLYLKLLFFLSTRKEFRDVYYFRFRHSNLLARSIVDLLSLFYRGQVGFEIITDKIGPGFYIQHGQCTIIGAKEIGSNFFVGHLVTIGHKGPYAPYIGNNVTIRAGSIVIGDVIVDDNAVIGAGAIVTKDVAKGETIINTDKRL